MASRGLVPFHPVSTVDDLSAWLDRPGDALLFLHDPGCPISLRAYSEVSRVPGEVALLDVRAVPAFADAVEVATGVTHESPQAILLRDGAPVWSASHFAVTSEAIAAASATAPA